MPPAFTIDKAKVLLLRVTIPMDFYTSPISIEVDGVDVRLRVVSDEPRQPQNTGHDGKDSTARVPNATDLAQSFLETQPLSERKELESAIATETQDLGASVSVSDEGSEPDQAMGTGQPLSLPGFLTDFLQGIVDRVQITIKGVTFQLNLEVPAELNSTRTEPVSFQIVVGQVEVEGITTSGHEDLQSSALAYEGKRHVCLSNIRANLVSQADAFAGLTRSPSTASPSMASSPMLTRNPPSRQATSLSEGSFHEQPMAGLQEEFRERLEDDTSHREEDPLADSEDALGIPYDLSDVDMDPGLFDDHDDGPSTPKPRSVEASAMFGLPTSPSLFHSTITSSSEREDVVEEPMVSTDSRLAPEQHDEAEHFQDPETASPSVEDLAQSQLYTHEEAESMFMSAFSHAPVEESISSQQAEQTAVVQHSEPVGEVAADTKPTTQAMPGSWDDAEPASNSVAAQPERRALAPEESSDTESSTSEPAFSRATLPLVEQSEVGEPGDEAGDTGPSTPKGPPKVVKEVLRMGRISLRLPTQHQHLRVQVDPSQSVADFSESLGQSSVYPQAPGAFSVHTSPAAPKPAAKQRDVTDSGANELEVSLSPITVNFDASIAFLLAMAVERLLTAAKSKPSPSTATSSPDKSQPGTFKVKLAVEEIIVNFLNRLSGVVSHSESFHPPSPFIQEQEILLNMSMKTLALSFGQKQVGSLASSMVDARTANELAAVTKLSIQKFRLGYAKGDILSFDGSRQLSTSVRDSFLYSGHDIGVEVIQIGDTTRTSVETLPLVVQVDLQRLDETFGWFGGLSSFLNMSASVTSPPSIPRPAPAATPKPRGVHFATPIDPNDKSAKSQNKINVRIGGALVELVGKDCSVAAEASALKAVSRDEGIGLGCSRLRISGPYLRRSQAEPAIVSELKGIRIEFLMAPKDTDLEKLLELIIPSKVKFDHESDEVMVDTLLRQRRKGSVLRTNIELASISVKNVSQLAALPALGEEIAKLGAVAKYLPEDDRPGLLTLAKIQRLKADLDLTDTIGMLDCSLDDLELGHITVPSLIAVALHRVQVRRNKAETLLSSDILEGNTDPMRTGPVVMVRMIGDEMDPVIKLKLQDLRFEYRVQTVMDVLGLGLDATPQDFEASLAASVANLGDQAHAAIAATPASTDEKKRASAKPTLDVGLRDCIVGLNPYKLPSKMLVALTDAHVQAVLPQEGRTKVSVNINNASVLLIDDVAQIAAAPNSVRTRPSSAVSRQVVELCGRGFVDVCYISSASAVAHMVPDANGDVQVDIEVREDLLVLETCADSTQTLITLANALKPPTPPTKENRFRTQVLPVQDLLASISAEAFGRPEGEYDFDQDFAGAQEMAGTDLDDLEQSEEGLLSVDSRFYGSQPAGEELFDATNLDASQETRMEDTSEGVLLTGLNPSQSEVSQSSSDLVIEDNFYSPDAVEDHGVKVWNSAKSSYDRAPTSLVKRCPVRVSVKDAHLIWNLFDGYDWEHTRQVITKAVEEVEIKAAERQSSSRRDGFHVYDDEEDDETIGDFLFNSIYIGVSPNRDRDRDLAQAINQNINDAATETESVATTTMTANTTRTARHVRPSSKRLRLQRSKNHKITFELHGVNADLAVFPPESGETVSSLDVQVHNLDIFDHVPTSTWKKFATYDQDYGEREMGTSMVHVELLNVKPLPTLPAAEMVLRATVLPLRLHVDQDALDFITRFFEFKDENVPVHASPSDVPFVQRAEVKDIPVKLDFKPKRVDYGGIRSGHTTEFMNFIVLEEARLVLRRVIIYGTPGFDRLGRTLNDLWMPDVRVNQLPGVLAGLAPLRSLVNIGSGFRDLIEIPIREYSKDGRVMRSISKGATAFARTTGTELVKLGAKLAVGTQYALQGAEDMLTETQTEGWDDEDPDERKQISLYADPPTGVLQGIRGGFRSLARDVSTARDAIIAVPGEVMATQSASGAAKAVWKRAPTIVFRPAMGVSKAIGQTLLGATNTLDHENQRRVNEVCLHFIRGPC